MSPVALLDPASDATGHAFLLCVFSRPNATYLAALA